MRDNTRLEDEKRDQQKQYDKDRGSMEVQLREFGLTIEEQQGQVDRVQEERKAEGEDRERQLSSRPVDVATTS